MRFQLPIVAAAAALLSGCSGAISTPPAGGAFGTLARAHPSIAGINAKAGLIYSSSFGGDTVSYYDKGSGPNNPVAGSLTGTFANPAGMAVDTVGDLYVANGNDENVLIYAKGSTSPTGSLSTPREFPIDVSVGSNGTVYVANGIGPMGASGNVMIFPKGASQPATTLYAKCFTQVAGVAVDKAGDVFASCNPSHGEGQSTVVEFKGGSGNAVQTHIALGGAGGLGFDRQGHLLAVDEVAQTLDVFKAGERTPMAKLTLPGTSAYFAFNHAGDVLYVADFSLGEIDVFHYTPQKLTQTNTITNGLSASSDDIGVADTPPEAQ